MKNFEPAVILVLYRRSILLLLLEHAHAHAHAHHFNALSGQLISSQPITLFFSCISFISFIAAAIFNGRNAYITLYYCRRHSIGQFIS